jgi:hypothetical protein
MVCGVIAGDGLVERELHLRPRARRLLTLVRVAACWNASVRRLAGPGGDEYAEVRDDEGHQVCQG